MYRRQSPRKSDIVRVTIRSLLVLVGIMILVRDIRRLSDGEPLDELW